MKRFFNDIKHSNYQEKKKWLIIFSTIAIILIIILWVINVKSILGTAQPKEIVTTIEEGSSFFANIKDSFSELYGDVKEQASETTDAIKELLSKENDINIEKE